MKTTGAAGLRPIVTRLHVDLIATADVEHARELRGVLANEGLDVPLLLISDASLNEASHIVQMGLVDDVLPAWMPTAQTAERLLHLAQRSLRGEEIVHGMPRRGKPPSHPVPPPGLPTANTPSLPPTRASSTTPPPVSPSTLPPGPPTTVPPPPDRNQPTIPPHGPSTIPPPTAPPPAPSDPARNPPKPRAPERTGRTASLRREGSETVRPISRHSIPPANRSGWRTPMLAALAAAGVGAALMYFDVIPAGRWFDDFRRSHSSQAEDTERNASRDTPTPEPQSTPTPNEPTPTEPDTAPQRVDDPRSIFWMPDTNRPGCDELLSEWQPALPLADDERPGRALTHRRLAQQHLMRGEADQATLELCKAATLNATGKGAEMLVAHFLANRSYANAQKWLDRALASAPENEALQKLQADVFNQRGQLEESKRVLIQALEIEDDPAVLRAVGTRFVQQAQRSMRAGDHTRGERYLRRALTLYPEHTGAAALLAHSLSRQDQKEASMAWAEHARAAR